MRPWIQRLLGFNIPRMVILGVAAAGLAIALSAGAINFVLLNDWRKTSTTRWERFDAFTEYVHAQDQRKLAAIAALSDTLEQRTSPQALMLVIRDVIETSVKGWAIRSPEDIKEAAASQQAASRKR